jgi:hypothetical protein
MVDELIGHQTLEGRLVMLVSRLIDGVKRLQHFFLGRPGRPSRGVALPPSLPQWSGVLPRTRS